MPEVTPSICKRATLEASLNKVDSRVKLWDSEEQLFQLFRDMLERVLRDRILERTGV